MPDIVFLELNSSYSHSMLSYCLIRALAEREVPSRKWGHVAATVKTPVEEILSELESLRPDMLLATAYIFNLTKLREICALLKSRREDLYICLGGPCFLGDNEKFLRENPAVDSVIRGDESSIPDLLTRQEPEKIAGLCWIDHNGVYHDNAFAEYTGELDSLPSPYQLDLVHGDKAFYQLETSRGCGGACSFCTSAGSRGVKYHSLKRVRNDLRALQQAGYREIRLVDRTFNEDSSRAVEMLEMFAEDFPDMRFHLEIHPGRLKPEVLAQLAIAKPGSLHLEAGIQSFDPVVLRNIRRPAVAAKAESGLKALLALKNLEVHTDLIAGLPGQTLASLTSDIEKMLCLEPEEIQLENLKILPGTELAEQPPPGLSFNPEPPWEVMSTVEMDAADLKTASLYSYIIDSWYNPPQLQNLFRFCCRRIVNFFQEFAAFVEEYCDLDKGKMPLERRFDLLEEFLQKRDREALELCRFTKIACGFACKGVPLRKYNDIPANKIIWRRDDLKEDTKIRRYIMLKCSFNAADFWQDSNAVMAEQPATYLFKIHYGRNVASIAKCVP